MTGVWVGAVLVVAGVGAAGYLLRARRPGRTRPVAFRDEREERLARRVARTVGCSSAAVVAAVRREIELSPNQSDDVLAKRAAYHYRQAIPERTCSTYRDAAPG